MRFVQSVSFTETDQLVDLARCIEEVGFDGILLSDHLFYPEQLCSRYPYSPDGNPGFDGATEWPDPWPAIAAMAQVTERVFFTTAIYILPLRDPLVVAKAAATLQILTGGRFALGVGVGWMREEFDQLGLDFATRGRRTDEMIPLLRALWKGGMVEHHGEFFDFDRLQQSPAPPCEIPIWVGGASPAALRRAGRLGDGWIGAGNTAAQIPPLLEEIARHRRQAGRDDRPFEVIAAITDPPTTDAIERLEAAGVTALVHYPLTFSLGPGSTLAQKRDALKRYADEVIASGRPAQRPPR
ncbi:MAG: LLM class F420-dependent oxidoreductase [Myxococcota bacterium]